jgi:hypothetical protein
MGDLTWPAKNHTTPCRRLRLPAGEFTVTLAAYAWRK